MRQVGVQVQDYGTHLCWQSFVDDPGNELGVSTLVHIAQPADLQGIKEPDKPTQPEPEISAPARSLTAHWGGDDDNPHNGFVPFVSRLLVVPPKPGYLYSRSEVEVVSGPHWWFRARPETSTDTTIDFEAGALTLGGNDVDMIDTGDGSGKTEASIKTIWVGAQMPPSSMTDDGDYDWTLKVTLFFRPSLKLQHDITVDYNLRLKDYSDAKKLAMQETVFKEARDRVKAASNIQPRRFDDLREEERTVVYRTLIRQLLRVAGINDEDHRVRHIFSELVESLFDVDRMLYFVAPEWWMPRFAPLLHRTQQDVGLQGDQGTFDKSELVSWGGAKALRPDNYYLTEDSTPAKLGSSLGWLIQLDGDNLRNAFLNAPWVKAIIPIRAGREWRALGWLSSQQIEGADGLDALYAARDAAERQHIVDILKANTWDDPAQAARYTSLDPNAITILDAINYLIVRIRAKQLVETTSMPDPADPTLGYLPTDQVFEHGFNPLQGGFRADPKDSVAHAFEVFDQWVEVLPTDQIVPVEVSYDPKTGMQI